jgi:hypothetical protein
MMHPVHVGCHDKKPEDPIHLFGNVNVAVVEHRCGVKGHLKDEDSRAGGPSAATGVSLMPMEMTISMGWKRNPVVTSKSRSAW